MVAKRRLRLSGDALEKLPHSDWHFKEPVVNCPLCGRLLPSGASVDEHHLIPRSQGGKEKYRIHRICHRKIHATLTEKELAHEYSTWEALKLHSELQTFIKWVAKRPADFMDNSRKMARLRM
jgi:5-methylcytosine-specific restriction endonuclease McrA